MKLTYIAIASIATIQTVQATSAKDDAIIAMSTLTILFGLLAGMLAWPKLNKAADRLPGAERKKIKALMKEIGNAPEATRAAVARSAIKDHIEKTSELKGPEHQRLRAAFVTYSELAQKYSSDTIKSDTDRLNQAAKGDGQKVALEAGDALVKSATDILDVLTAKEFNVNSFVALIDQRAALDQRYKALMFDSDTWDLTKLLDFERRAFADEQKLYEDFREKASSLEKASGFQPEKFKYEEWQTRIQQGQQLLAWERHSLTMRATYLELSNADLPDAQKLAVALALRDLDDNRVSSLDAKTLSEFDQLDEYLRYAYQRVEVISALDGILAIFSSDVVGDAKAKAQVEVEERTATAKEQAAASISDGPQGRKNPDGTVEPPKPQNPAGKEPSKLMRLILSLK